MEIHPGIYDWALRPSLPIDCLKDLWDNALTYTKKYLPDTFKEYSNKKLDIDNLSVETFWKEYIWCVYTSGFNAKIVSKKIDDLMKIYKSSPYEFCKQDLTIKVYDVLEIINHRKKYNAICYTATRIVHLTDSWNTFKKLYLSSIDDIPKGCNWIGPITKYHLARNLGYDCIKPDKHLVRLANKLNYQNPSDLIDIIAKNVNYSKGIIDLCLWAYCAAYYKDLFQEGENEIV